MLEALHVLISRINIMFILKSKNLITRYAHPCLDALSSPIRGRKLSMPFLDNSQWNR